jgi:hypothetical protein
VCIALGLAEGGTGCGAKQTNFDMFVYFFIERSPIYPPKLVSKFTLQPFTLLWFNLQPQTLKTVQNCPFL